MNFTFAVVIYHVEYLSLVYSACIKRQHSTYQIQHKLLHYYIRKWNALVPKTRLRNQVRDWYFKVQKKPIPQQENTEVLLQELKNYYKPYNTELLEIASIDLRKW